MYGVQVFSVSEKHSSEDYEVLKTLSGRLAEMFPNTYLPVFLKEKDGSRFITLNIRDLPMRENVDKGKRFTITIELRKKTDGDRTFLNVHCKNLRKHPEELGEVLTL
jgi:hypothetical protein